MAQATQIDWDNADELTTEQLDELEMRSQGMAGANPGAIAATPFYQDRVEGRSEPPEDEALTDTEFDEMREQKYADPAYIMTREEFDEFYEDRIKDREFERFVDGAVEGVKALVPLAGQVAEDITSVGRGLLTEPLTTNARITQTLGEATRLVGVNLAQLYDWGSHKLSAAKRSSERAELVDQSIRERLEQEGKFTGDREQDMQIFAAAKFEARKAGAYDITEEQAAEDRTLAYDHYVRQKAFDQEAAKVKEVSYGGNEVQIESMTEDKYRLANAEPYEGLAMATSMVVDPINLIPVGAGYFAKLRLLRRMSHLEKPTALAGKGAANLAEKANRLENAISSRVQQITGLTPDQQVAGSALMAGAALYVDQTVGGGGYLHKGVATVVGAPAALRMGGGVLRRTGQGLDSASIVMREAGTGGIGATRAAAASDLRTNAAIPERYRKFYDGGFNYSADSTLRRVAANPELPGPMRGFARLADKAGATQAFRLTDDAVSGMAAGAAIGAPFAFLPDDPTRQGNIFGAITAFGALGGVASGTMGRSRAVVDADIARMFADVYAVGGNVERMAQLPHRTLDQMSAMQGMLSGKVDFVPLDGVEFHAQTKSNNAGLFLEKGTDGRGRVFINMDAVSEKGGITAHEIGHAILTSNVLDGQPRADLRNLVSQQYGTDGIQARGREYAAKVVDGELRARTTGDEPSILTETEMKRMDEGATIQDIVAERAANDPEYRNKLIDDKMKELDDAYMSEGGQPLDWARDEIIAESFSADAPLMDFRSIRNREMAPYLAESALAAMSRVFETFGARFSDTGKLLDSPNRIFSENPLFRDPVVQRRIKEYVRTYDNFLEGMENNGAAGKPGVQIARTGRPEDLGRSPHVKLRDEGNGVLENDFMVQLPDGTFRLKSQQTVNAAEAARAAQIKTLYNAQKRVPPNSTEFGVRVVDGRETVGGPVLPKQFDLFTNFPKHVREAARGFETGRERGESWFIDYNAIGTGASGRYRVTNLGNVRAIQREVVPFGWQVSKANHLLAVSLDLNAFRAAAMKAINRGELGVFNNEMAQVETAFKTYLDNHRNGRPGEAGIGMEARDVLNGLIGTGTAVQRKANPLYTALNPKGSIRTFRMDRLNEARTSGREGFTFDYDKTKFNRMPDDARSDRADIPLNPRARQAAFISDTGEVRATGRPTHFETNADLGPDFMAIGAGHLGEDGFFRFGSQSMDNAFGDSPANSYAAAARHNQALYDGGKRPSAMLEEPPGLERQAVRGQAMPDTGATPQPRRYVSMEKFIEEAGDELGEVLPNAYRNLEFNDDNYPTHLVSFSDARNSMYRSRVPSKEFFDWLHSSEVMDGLVFDEVYTPARPGEGASHTRESYQALIDRLRAISLKPSKQKATGGTRGQAMPDVGALDQSVGGFIIDPGDATSLPVHQQASRGKPAFDAKGKPKYIERSYDLINAPNIKNYRGPGPEDVSKPNYKGLAYDLTLKGQKEIDAAIDSGAVDFAANRIVQITEQAMKNPEIAAGMGWYSRMRKNLLDALGEDGRELLSQLLGATSAKTPVEANFLQAMDALEGIRAGRYDRHRKSYLEMLAAEEGNNLTALIVERGYATKVRQMADELSKASRKFKGDKKKAVLAEAAKLRSLGKTPASQWTKKDRFAIMINATDMLPMRSNGKKFNANSMAVLKVIAGTWLDNRKSPKTPNFAGNLSGRTVQATIDVWAARMLRETLYEGSTEPWRIQPRSETGVNNQDFALGQVIMQRAAKKLGMNPDDLQAVLWFAEKHRWDERGWTKNQGAEKSSFDEVFKVFFPKGKKPLTFAEASKIFSERE